MKPSDFDGFNFFYIIFYTFKFKAGIFLTFYIHK